MCESHGHSERAAGTSDAFQTFLVETPAHADAWMEMAHRLEHATALDSRTAASLTSRFSRRSAWTAASRFTWSSLARPARREVRSGARS